MDEPFKKNATYDDLYAIPDGWTGEIIDGDLYAFPRPRAVHSLAISEALIELAPASRNRSPNGWTILPEVEIYFGKHLLVPDLAGWRRERMPEMPDVQTFELAPDWVCEGISPSTARIDRGRKREIYAKGRVGYIWFVDPAHHTLEVLTLDGKTSRVTATGGKAERGVFAPFEHEIDLSQLWQR